MNGSKAYGNQTLHFHDKNIHKVEEEQKVQKVVGEETEKVSSHVLYKCLPS